MKIIVIYHRADFDGIFCREIAKKFLPNARLIGWDYGDPVPQIDEKSGMIAFRKSPDEEWEVLNSSGVYPEIYMLDISVDGLMNYPNLIWIDHHKSAIEKFKFLNGYQIDGVAACRLAWQWFTNVGPDNPKSDPVLATGADFVDRNVKEPLAVRLAGEYDIWDKRDPRAELFQHGLRSRELTDWDWKMMLSPDRRPSIAEIDGLVDVGHQGLMEADGTIANATVLGLLKNGEVLQYAQTQQNESIIRAAGFTVDFEGVRFLACNHARYNSHLFTAGLTDEHDACLGFNFDGKQWRVSLYHAPGKEHHDLSTIAVKYDGGGHRGACGFRLADLPFIKAASPQSKPV